MTSVIIRSGSSRRPVLSEPFRLEYVATGTGPAPNSPSGSQAPRTTAPSSRMHSRKTSQPSGLGRASWNPRMSPSSQPFSSRVVSGESSRGSRVLNVSSTSANLATVDAAPHPVMRRARRDGGLGQAPYAGPMTFLIIVALVVVGFVVWKFRVQLMAKVLGQSESRVRRQLNRRRD